MKNRFKVTTGENCSKVVEEKEDKAFEKEEFIRSQRSLS